MVEPISATGVVLLGAGAWLSDKLFGPSAGALGDQLKIFATSRIAKILRRAEEQAIASQSNPVPPPFAYLFVQRASLSEDDDTLTEMWANLLLSASEGYVSRHINFVEILSQINAQEAVLLNEAVPQGMRGPPTPPVNLKSAIRDQLFAQYRAICDPAGTPQEEMAERARIKHSQLMQTALLWPGRITAVKYPYSDVDMKIQGSVDGGVNLDSSYDVLIRQRLLEPFSFDLSQSFSSPYVEGHLVTALGVEFVLTCRGTERIRASRSGAPA